MPSDQTRATAYLSGPDGLYAVLPCPTCRGVMVHADALRDPGFRRDLPKDYLGFINFSHTVPATDGGTEGGLECDTCNNPRGRSLWTPPDGTPTARVARLALYTEAHERMKAQREALREARRRNLRGE